MSRQKRKKREKEVRRATRAQVSREVPKVTGNLSALIDSFERSSPELPLVHSTLAESLNSIIAAGCLEPRKCAVFSQRLVYLFYGRPAYRSKRGADPDTEHQYCPICFILKTPFQGPVPVRIYPFDSGAASAGTFGPALKAHAQQFEIPAKLDAVRRFTTALFATNAQYLVGKLDTVLNAEPGSVLDHLLELLSRTGRTNYDDRRSVVEVQFQDPIDLSETIEAIALPSRFLDDEAIRKAIVGEWGAFPLTYTTVVEGVEKPI